MRPDDWIESASCAQVGGDLWFPKADEQYNANRAKQICAACPVRKQCGDMAAKNDEMFGIWGGIDARSRRRLREHDTAKRHGSAA